MRLTGQQQRLDGPAAAREFYLFTGILRYSFGLGSGRTRAFVDAMATAFVQERIDEQATVVSCATRIVRSTTVVARASVSPRFDTAIKPGVVKAQIFS